MPFTKETLDFMVQNYITDSRSWFHEHKADYKKLVEAPLEELVVALTPAMLEIDPEFICIPKVGKTISRIWRDTRRGPELPVFRDVMWINFMRAKYLNLPGFWFEFSPRAMRWGCGWYSTDARVMETARSLILANGPTWRDALDAVEAQDKFHLEDTRYKRSRHPDEPEQLRWWLDQKSLCLIHETDDISLLFSKDLPDVLATDFRSLAPAYNFFMQAVSMTPGK